MPAARPTTTSRPRRIVELYSYRRGWERSPRRLVLDTDTACGLRGEGFTMVRVRMSLRASREVSLIRFLDGAPRADGLDAAPSED
ncbi:hypothetical protein ACIQLJ_13750 [Microbacterium sp. NPDC091313]